MVWVELSSPAQTSEVGPAREPARRTMGYQKDVPSSRFGIPTRRPESVARTRWLGEMTPARGDNQQYPSASEREAGDDRSGRMHLEGRNL